MAATNYLTQNLAMFFTLYGFGLGLLPYAGDAFCVTVALIFFSIQIPASRWWLSRFRFGPVEWLWRAATYGHWPSMQRRQPLPGAP